LDTTMRASTTAPSSSVTPRARPPAWLIRLTGQPVKMATPASRRSGEACDED